ncbi:rta1 domain [Fusarium albosuccineum]|uniref:Rta1 domain n=1 Tax=Fusarium albosuccineum TaxID=1237068 RepID=A0A8H4L9U3_9HYPO|nr:rta1 domain [Fusarium albosuccineum]
MPFLCVQIVLAFLKRVYSYSIVIAASCLIEALGYAGRILMHNNPWNRSGMRLQIVCLIIGPSFTAAGIYLTLKHFVRTNHPECSKLRPTLYTWIFIGCDIVSILLQAAGGGIAAGADKDPDKIDLGNNIIITGIAFQVVTMAGCGLLTVDYALRLFRRKRYFRHMEDQPIMGYSSSKTRIFQGAVTFAYVTVLVRCIYRIPEMAGGWGNPRMRNEKEFLLLDGLMIALAAIALTAFHPGFFFPAMRTGSQGKDKESSSPSNDVAL